MRNLTALFASIFLCFSMWFPAPAFAAENPSLPNYKVTPDVTYGQGEIFREGESILRDLWMDVYEPLAKKKKNRPATIFTYGGSFHRGSPRTTFDEGGAQDTSAGDYCRKFAMQGYVCFAIDYRLIPENPVPSGDGYTEDDIDMTKVGLTLPGVNKIRASMDLEPLDIDDPKDLKLMTDGVLSAAEDLRTALRHIRKSARIYNIDPDSIVLGGFSAGAITSLNVAHGMHEPVAGLFMLSGSILGLDILKMVSPASASPPILMLQSQMDLEPSIISTPMLMERYQEVGVPYAFAWVPASGHYYTSGASSLAGDGSRLSIEQRIVQFIEEVVGESPSHE
ncbi:MAG: alpha/beta hydrolase fold domain-containing protein [Okeania sp. SIO3H1]|nr:alpha/beta hydrolase fold domain-containing protein [Okeania sp. SIO3H1]